MGAACGSTDDAKQDEKTTTKQDKKESEGKEKPKAKGPEYRLKDIEELWILLAHYSDSDAVPAVDDQSFNISELVAFLKMAADVKDSLENNAQIILERLSVYLIDKMRDGKTIRYRDFWLIVIKILRELYIKPIVVVISEAIEADREATLGIKATREFDACEFDEFIAVQELWNVVSSYSVNETEDLSKQSFNLSELAAFIKIADDVKVKMEDAPEEFLDKVCESFKGNMSDAQPMIYVEFRGIVLGLLQTTHIQPLLKVIAEAIENDKKTALDWELDLPGYEKITLKGRRASKSKMDIVADLWTIIAGYSVENNEAPPKDKELTTSELVAFLKIAEDVMQDLDQTAKFVLGKIMNDLRIKMKQKIPIIWKTFRELVMELLKDSFIMPIAEGISNAVDEDRKKLLGFEIKSNFKFNAEEFKEILELWNAVAGYRGDEDTSVKDQAFYLSELVAFMKIAEDTNEHLEEDARFLLGWLCKSLVYEFAECECTSLSYVEFRAVLISLMEDIHIKPLIDGIAQKVESDRMAVLNGVAEPARDPSPEKEPAPAEDALPEQKEHESEKEEGQSEKKENEGMNEEGAGEKEEAEVPDTEVPDAWKEEAEVPEGKEENEEEGNEAEDKEVAV